MYLPIIKILMPIIIGSAMGPLAKANSATAIANTAANKLPSARLNPFCSVAPKQMIITKLESYLAISCYNTNR